jgi:transposase
LIHANAKLTLAGRLLIIERLTKGWTQAQVAEAQGVSRATVAKWRRRHRLEGVDGLRDGSCKAHSFPTAAGEQVVEAICRLRRELGVGPHRIAYELGNSALHGLPDSRGSFLPFDSLTDSQAYTIDTVWRR